MNIQGVLRSPMVLWQIPGCRQLNHKTNVVIHHNIKLRALLHLYRTAQHVTLTRIDQKIDR